MTGHCSNLTTTQDQTGGGGYDEAYPGIIFAYPRTSFLPYLRLSRQEDGYLVSTNHPIKPNPPHLEDRERRPSEPKYCGHRIPDPPAFLLYTGCGRFRESG